MGSPLGRSSESPPSLGPGATMPPSSGAAIARSGATASPLPPDAGDGLYEQPQAAASVAATKSRRWRRTAPRRARTRPAKAAARSASCRRGADASSSRVCTRTMAYRRGDSSARTAVRDLRARLRLQDDAVAGFVGANLLDAEVDLVHRARLDRRRDAVARGEGEH